LALADFSFSGPRSMPESSRVSEKHRTHTIDSASSERVSRELLAIQRQLRLLVRLLLSCLLVPPTDVPISFALSCTTFAPSCAECMLCWPISPTLCPACCAVSSAFDVTDLEDGSVVGCSTV
jgi:hypothetical protein